MKSRKSKGFTLAELLIVVAVIAVLTAIVIPIFTRQMERARRAVDMDHARNIETALMIAFTDGTIEVPESLDKGGNGIGAWVTICRDPQSVPRDYWFMGNRTAYCGADTGVIVNGSTSAGWSNYNTEVAGILDQSGIDVSKLKVRSNGKDDGWDWIIIEVGYNKNGFYSRIYSGFKSDMSSADRVGESNIEKQIG